MAAYTIRRVDEMEAIYRGGFRRARAALGVESFGMAVIDLPANFDAYPEHDHTHDGQEEVYVTLAGGGEIELDGERHALDPETFVRVGPPRRALRLGRRDQLLVAPTGLDLVESLGHGGVVRR